MSSIHILQTNNWSAKTFGRRREATIGIINALPKNARVMRAALPASVTICEAQVHVYHAHAILRSF